MTNGVFISSANMAVRVRACEERERGFEIKRESFGERGRLILVSLRDFRGSVEALAFPSDVIVPAERV